MLALWVYFLFLHLFWSGVEGGGKVLLEISSTRVFGLLLENEKSWRGGVVREWIKRNENDYEKGGGGRKENEKEYYRIFWISFFFGRG